MTVLKDTLKQLIPEDWKNDLTYEDVKYVCFDWVQGPHCDQATKYRDVAGNIVYTCKHENPNYKGPK